MNPYRNRPQIDANSIHSASKKEWWIPGFILHLGAESWDSSYIWKSGWWFKFELNYHHSTAKKTHFLSNCAYNTELFFDFFARYSIVFLHSKCPKKILYDGTDILISRWNRKDECNHHTFWCVNIESSSKTRKIHITSTMPLAIWDLTSCYQH